MSLVGLDIGTTGCKCTIFNFEGKIRSSSYREYGDNSSRAGKYELNPEKVWESVKGVIYEAVSEYKGEEPSALAVSSFGEAAVPVDAGGNILYNSILFMDDRGNTELEKLKNRLDPIRIMELTGVPAHPMYTVNKIMWIRENLPEIFGRTWKFMLFEDLILFLLTGNPVIDYSLASRTMAFNVVDKVWEPVMLEAAGLEEKLFSKAVPSGTIAGSIKKELAEELGLPSGLVVVTGGHDQACAALGAGILSEGSAVEGIGTADCITTAFSEPALNSTMLKSNLNCEPHILENMYVSLAFSISGGSLLQWYRDCFAAAGMLEAKETGKNIYNILDTKAAAEPTDILVLPHFSGSGTPHLDPGSKGAFIGITLDTTPSQIYRALMEGVTYEMRYNLDFLESAGIKVNSLRAVGGGAKSDLWLQIKADITGRNIETLDTGEAGTLAAAIIAGKAVGVYPSYQQAAKGLIRSKKTYYPNPVAHDRYNENYFRYKQLYQAVKSVL